MTSQKPQSNNDSEESTITEFARILVDNAEEELAKQQSKQNE
jgi:hypothetical protein